MIKNITLQQLRRIDLEFPVSYDAGIDKVNTILTEVIKSHEKVLEEPAATIQMDKLTPYSMVFCVRPWVERVDYWPVRWELLRIIKERLDAEGILIPVLNSGIVAPE